MGGTKNFKGPDSANVRLASTEFDKIDLYGKYSA